MPERAITIHGAEDARAALRAAVACGVAVTLISAPAAAGYAGAGWFRALHDLVSGEFPQARQRWILDCGAAPGHVLAALRAGCEALVFTGDERVRGKLAAIAAQLGATLLAARPESLDLREARDQQAALRAWLRDAA
jgi:hypothetical protein